MSAETSPEGLVDAIRDAARRGDLQHAGRLVEAATALLPSGGPEAATLANLAGGIAFELGDLDRAEHCFERVLRAAEASGNALLGAKAATNLGSIAHLRGKVQLAASLYASARAACAAAGDMVGVARAEHNLAIVERERGALDRAQAHAEAAMAVARRTRDSGLIALTLCGAAELAVERGHLGLARRQLAAARALADLADDALGLVEVARIEARLSLRREELRESLREARRAYLQARRLGSLQLSGESALVAAQASRGLDRTRLADRFRRQAAECFRALGAVTALERLRTV